MKRLILTGAIIASFFASQTEVSAQANNSKNAKAATSSATENSNIEKLIYAYQDALNASDVDKVINLYTTNGVLLANAAPTAEGTQQVKGTYQYVFDNFKYTLKFTILDVEVKGNTAFTRATSKGSFVMKSNGQTVPDENRELFVFEKENGQWKIASYMYNKTK